MCPLSVSIEQGPSARPLTRHSVRGGNWTRRIYQKPAGTQVLYCDMYLCMLLITTTPSVYLSPSLSLSLSLSTEPQEQPRPTNPNPYTAGYFQSPQQQQQQPQLPPPNQLDTSHMTTDSTQYHTSMMYSQLALTSNMCSELLHTQSSLICAMCSHMEMFRYQTGIHQHYSALCQYQKELEQYYQDLYRSYSQVSKDAV